MAERYDPHDNKRKYKQWRNEKGAPFEGVSEKTADLMRQYLDDMEIGANVSAVTKKGPRSYIRLINLKSKIHSWAIILQQEMGTDYFPDLENKRKEFLQLIKKLRDGEILNRSRNPKPYTGVGTLIKAFKAMWHWYQKIKRDEGIEIKDITQDVDGHDEKPHFNYFTIEQLNELCNKAKYEYKVLMMFLFDTGIRAPTEMMNVKVSDLEWSEDKKHYTLTIRPETSKTFGRRIKLLLCSAMLKEYVKKKKLQENEFIFKGLPSKMNEYLKRLAWKTLNIGELQHKRKMKSGAYYYALKNGLTMYDFRHSSACYWLPRYKSESALKYRFGWTRSSMIHYYTELLGMRDTIEEDDLYVDISKTQLEREISSKGNEITLLQEQLAEEEKKTKLRDQKMKEQEDKLNQMMKMLEAINLEKIANKKPFEEYTEV